LANRALNLLIVGLNHRSAPVEVREQLAFSDGTLETALRRLVDAETVREGAILSTCNRVEVVACATDLNAASEKIKTFLADQQRIARSLLEWYLYTHTGNAAVGHLLLVAASLDSLVVGDPQVLAPVQDASGA